MKKLILIVNKDNIWLVTQPRQLTLFLNAAITVLCLLLSLVCHLPLAKMAFRVIKQRREARRNAKLEEIFMVMLDNLRISDVES